MRYFNRLAKKPSQVNYESAKNVAHPIPGVRPSARLAGVRIDS